MGDCPGLLSSALMRAKIATTFTSATLTKTFCLQFSFCWALLSSCSAFSMSENGSSIRNPATFCLEPTACSLFTNYSTLMLSIRIHHCALSRVNLSMTNVLLESCGGLRQCDDHLYILHTWGRGALSELR